MSMLFCKFCLFSNILLIEIINIKILKINDALVKLLIQTNKYIFFPVSDKIHFSTQEKKATLC